MQLNYLVSVFAGGKYVDSYYLKSLDDLPDIKSRHKDCEIGILNLQTFENYSKEHVEKEIQESIMRRARPKENPKEIVKEEIIKKPKKVKPKKYWDRPVLCVETGEVYRTIKECSKQTGIPYMTITNCIKNGNSTRGFHFVNAPKKEDENGENADRKTND